MFNQDTMVYLNKVFTDTEALSCPLLGELTASAATFDQQLSFYDQHDDCGCGSGCNCGCNLDFGDDANFVIESTRVCVTAFDLEDPDDLTPADVTLNGINVDNLEYFNGRYMTAVRGLEPDCQEAMLLIRNAGSWQAKVSIVLYGSVFTCGGCRKFKLVMSTREGVSIDIPGMSTFAVTSLCIPCVTGGISPVISFSFKARASLLNPVIVADSGGGNCSLILTGALITEPIADIQVTRQTLFRIQGEMVEQSCDGAENNCDNCHNCGNADNYDRDNCDYSYGRSHSCDCGCGEISCQFNGYNGCSF